MSEPVNFNFRVVRTDGRPITGRVALAVLRYFVDHRREPDGFRIRIIDWQRAGRNARRAKVGRPRGDADERAALEAFWAILQATGLEGLRIGGVKRDRF